MFALDTNTVVHFFKGKGNVAARLASTPPRKVAIPAVVFYELQVGAGKSGQPDAKRAMIATLVSACRVLPFDEACATEAARIRVELERGGTPVGPMDILIAGTAVANSATLVTRNTREFSRVTGLQLDDWF